MKGIALTLITLVNIILAYYNSKTLRGEIKKRKVGKKGEFLARKIIKEGLEKGDILLSNVYIKHNGCMCECDDIIVNKYGVFVIEVKNYVGRLYGGINDKNWNESVFEKDGTKNIKRVKNPFVQIKRNLNIINGYLSNKKLKTHSEGFIIAPNNNQIVGKQVLINSKDVSNCIHNKMIADKHSYISSNKIKKIVKELKRNKAYNFIYAIKDRMEIVYKYVIRNN